MAGTFPGRSTAAHRYCSAFLVEGQKRQQRQVAPAIVMPVEEGELLGAVRRVVGRIQVDRDPPRPPVQPALMPLDDPHRQLARQLIEGGVGQRRSRTARSSAARPTPRQRPGPARAAAWWIGSSARWSASLPSGWPQAMPKIRWPSNSVSVCRILSELPAGPPDTGRNPPPTHTRAPPP